MDCLLTPTLGSLNQQILLNLVSDVFGLEETHHLPPSPLLPPHPGLSSSHTSETSPATTDHTQLELLQRLSPCWCQTQIYIAQLLVL